MSNVKNYTDAQILDRVKNLPSFKGFPTKFWLAGIRSNEDAFNRFDDKFYLFKGEHFVMVCEGTTNAGTDLLKPTNKRGEAVLEANHILYDVWERRKHKGKVLAYCQSKPMPICRDNDRDRKTEELIKAVWEITGINFHPVSYQIGSKLQREFIGNWSLGCQCPSIRAEFDEIMNFTIGQKFMTYAILSEW